MNSLEAGYDRAVVGPLSFTLDAGEIVALWGPNGSGKTTAMNAIGGGARVFGGHLRKQPGLRVSHQHQNPLSLRDIPLSGRELLALTQSDAKALPAAMQPLLTRRLSELSGGQLQVLQVWACLTAPVDLVMLDEPTNNVDIAGVALLQQVIAGARDGRGVLLVSHDRHFIEALGARIVEVERR
ncbi:MAG: ATP-binding cassette domain-containing protein [Betaproteobacteria bacterium]